MTMVYASRLLIERTLRDRLATVPNIRVEEGINIEGLETVDGGQPGGRVTGVWVTGGDGGRERRLVLLEFEADFTEGGLHHDGDDRGCRGGRWRTAGWCARIWSGSSRTGKSGCSSCWRDRHGWRGATHATFIDNSRDALTAAKTNAEEIGRAHV